MALVQSGSCWEWSVKYIKKIIWYDLAGIIDKMIQMVTWSLVIKYLLYKKKNMQQGGKIRWLTGWN
jgi:hypothetical protein